MALYASELTMTLEQKLIDMGSQVVRIEGDGFCLVNAVQTALLDPSVDVQLLTSDIYDKLRKEIHDNYDFYESFLEVKEGGHMSKSVTFRDDIDRLIAKGIYDNNSSDLALPALCNALNITIIILQPQGDSILQIRHSPSREDLKSEMRLVHLLRTPTEPEHYDAIVQIQPSTRAPIQSMSLPKPAASQKRKIVQCTIKHMFKPMGKKCKETESLQTLHKQASPGPPASADTRTSPGSPPSTDRRTSPGTPPWAPSIHPGASPGPPPWAPSTHPRVSPGPPTSTDIRTSPLSVSPSDNLQPTVPTPLSVSPSDNLQPTPLSVSPSDDVQPQVSSKGSATSTSGTQSTGSSRSTKYNWLLKNEHGYSCAICKRGGVSSKQGKGAWVTIPVKISDGDSSTLYKKAAKHASSSCHKFAVAAVDGNRKGSLGVAEQIYTAANNQVTVENTCMKAVFRVAYFLFASETAHTTNWRSLLSTVASCDASGNLQKFFEHSPANAHHLSTRTSTDILEAYGEAITQSIQSRVGKLSEYSVMADEATDCNGREMCSVCIRYLEAMAVKEVFLGCWPVVSTKAAIIHECISDALRKFGLDPANIVAASFDGASNMSGVHGGVQALLRNNAPDLIFVHCRSHLLQLAMVKASSSIPHIKRIIGVISKLYTFFQHSPLRIGVLRTVQMVIDGTTHKLVQPCDTRWLSNAGSVHVIVQHYGSILVALESIYTDAGDLSSDAGGLLLTLRKPSTLFFLTLLDAVLEPLARLSKCLQSADGNISRAMSIARAVTANVEETDLKKMKTLADEIKAKVTAAGARMVADEDLSQEEQLLVGRKYIATIVTNLKLRFSDAVSDLCLLQEILRMKPVSPSFEKIASVLHTDSNDLLSEWQILRRLPGDLSSHDEMLSLALSNEKQLMFPHFAAACRKILLLPIGTATVERSFSTMNRIMTSKRCRLNPNHTAQLMQLSIEGPKIPDVRDAVLEAEQSGNSAHNDFHSVVNAAHKIWLSKPRRGVE